MNARADLKNAKYLRKAQSMDADFSPLVVETHGRFHAGFLALLKRLATQLDGGQGLMVSVLQHRPELTRA